MTGNPIETLLGEDWKFNWNAVPNEGRGSCLYCVISQALDSINEKYSVSDLREIIAQTVTKDNLEHWKNEIIADKLANVTVSNREIKSGITRDRKKILTAQELEKSKYTVEDIRKFIRGNRYATIDDIKILSNVLNFIPIIIPNDSNYMSGICGAVEDPIGIITGDRLENTDIILIKLDVGAPHYELLEQRRTHKRMFKMHELPQVLIDTFIDSCELQLNLL